MKEITCLIDTATGQLTVEGLGRVEIEKLAKDLLPQAVSINCARPVSTPPLTGSSVSQAEDEPTLRIHRIYHNSVVDGPGRRSVIQTAGCNIRCFGCYIPETHDPDGGVVMTIGEVVELLLDPVGEPRDGVTILGGEPFLQIDGLAVLLTALKEQNQHITLYTGYTLEELQARGESTVNEILSLTDILIDGPFVASLSQNAGEWRGSTNQRIIYQPEIYQSLKAKSN